jgi:hypothetical protein
MFTHKPTMTWLLGLKNGYSTSGKKLRRPGITKKE